MNRDFKISSRAVRAKPLDLRRKVLLKNFFKTQNVFFHTAASVAIESFDFSHHESSQNMDEEPNIDIENDLSLDDECQDAPIESESQVSCEKENESSGSENTMKKVIPISNAAISVTVHESAASCTEPAKLHFSSDMPHEDKSESGDSSDYGFYCISESCDVPKSGDKSEFLAVVPKSQNPFPMKEKLSTGFRAKVKRKFSLKTSCSVTRRKANDVKVPIGKRISKNKLSTISMKSPKRKKATSFRAKINEMFASKPTVKIEKMKSYTLKGKQTSNVVSKSQGHCKFSDLTSRQNTIVSVNKSTEQSIADTSRSISVQTDICLTEPSFQDLENQNLRLENKNLKSKLQFLLSLNMRENWSQRDDVDFSELVGTSDSLQSHQKFESNQENKNGFKSCPRLTRSQSIQETSRDKDLHSQQKQWHCRRAKSISNSRDKPFDDNYFCKRSNVINQPFKPMQSSIFDEGHSRRKRKLSHPSVYERSRQSPDLKPLYGKRQRSVSLSYNPSV